MGENFAADCSHRQTIPIPLINDWEKQKWIIRIHDSDLFFVTLLGPEADLHRIQEKPILHPGGEPAQEVSRELPLHKLIHTIRDIGYRIPE